MKIFKINLNEENPRLKDAEELKLITLGDWHIGDSLFNMKLCKEVIKYIEENENVYCILNGDLINNATKNSVSDIYSEVMSPMQQVKVLMELLRPIKNKILVAQNGNHELRSYKESGIDIIYFVMSELGLSDRYTPEAYYIFLYFGEKQRGDKRPMVYTIYGKHNRGGGRTKGSKMNKVAEMSHICVADVYIGSHTHDPMAGRVVIYVPDFNNKSLTKKDSPIVISNSLLDYGGYGEEANYSPVSNEIIEVIFKGKYRKINYKG